MGLQPTYNEGFQSPDPGTCLFVVKEIKFDVNEHASTICTIQAEIVESFDAPQNAGRGCQEWHGLYPVESKGKTLYFGITNFMGFLHKATGKTKEVDEKYFDSPKVQAALEKALPGCLYAGDVIKESYTKDGVEKTGTKIKRYKSEAEYKALAKAYVPSATDNGSATAKSAPVAAAATAPADDDW